MTRTIQINSTNDIQKINAIVSSYPYDIWIHGRSGMADAKSLLGMFILGLNEPLSIVVPDDVNPSKLFRELRPFMVIEGELECTGQT